MFSLTLLLLPLLSATTFAGTIPRRELKADELLLWGSNGRLEVMKKDEYFLHRQNTTTIGRPESFITNTSAISTSSLRKRCDTFTIYTINPLQHFLNWDVPMSSVVFSGIGQKASVSVTEGYQISNSIGVSASATIPLIENVLSVSLGIDYSTSWTSTYAAAYSFSIPEGFYGAVVSNPATTRATGYMDYGCIGGDNQRESFQADSYNSKAYGGLSWVEGTISLCTGTEYPLKRCLGEGVLT